jgi:ABC-2 type transport system permease protein
MGSRLHAVVRKESREVLRDPIYLALAIFVPLFSTTLLALGFVLDVKNLPVAFCDQDRSSLSREYTHAFTNSEYFRLVASVGSPRDIDRLLERGEIRAGVIVPPEFSRRLAAGEPADVQILVDGTFPNRALIASGYIAAIDAEFSARRLASHLARRGLVRGTLLPVSIEGRVWFNPSLETKHSLVPGLMVITLMFYPGLLAALVVVRERERGTILNLYCSPVARWEVIVGKAVPYVGLASIVYALLFVLNIYAFGVRFVGDPLVLTAAALLYITASVGLGLLVSVLCTTQVAAMLVTFIGLMTPSIMFSGLLSPLSSMDRSAQIISRFIPASYFMAMVRGVYLKGLGFDAFARDLLTLVAFTLVVYSLAIAGFRKRTG